MCIIAVMPKPAELVTTGDRSTVTRLVSNGTVPTITKLPGKTGAYLFDRKTVEAFAAGRAA